MELTSWLAPEEDAWQFKAAETSTTEIQLLNRDQDTIAEVNYDDPKASEATEACDARTGEKLDPEEVRRGRAKEVRELVKMEEMRATPGKKI